MPHGCDVKDMDLLEVEKENEMVGNVLIDLRERS